jgi:hypothetical protein
MKQIELNKIGDLYQAFLTLPHKSIFLTQDERDGDILVTISLRVKRAVRVFWKTYYWVAQGLLFRVSIRG